MNLLKRFLPEIIVAIVLGLLFISYLSKSVVFESDLGRDSLAMWNILHGDMTLLGPKTSFGGLYTGPYYFYFFTPFLYLFHYNPLGIVIGNALLFIACSVIAFYLLRKKTTLQFAGVTMLWIVLTGYFLFSARNVTNASTYIAPLFLYLLILLYYYPFKSQNLLKMTVFGIGTGLIANIHPVSLIVMIPFSIAIFLLRRQKSVLKNLAVYISGFIITFLPLVLFEMTHNFIMIRNTFFDKSYELFTQRQNNIGQLAVSHNVFLNILNIDRITATWMHPSLIQLTVAGAILLFLLRKHKELIWIGLFFILNFFLYSFLFRFQAVAYYLFPLLVLTQVVIIYFLSVTSPVVRYGLLGVFIAMSFLYFPKYLYVSSYRTYDRMYNETKQAAHDLKLPHSDFDIVDIRDTSIGILGQEYRYILATLGYKTNDIYSYASSNYLIMISEKGSLDWMGQSSWEIDQFGKKELIKSTNIHGTFWYLFRKL